MSSQESSDWKQRAEQQERFKWAANQRAERAEAALALSQARLGQYGVHIRGCPARAADNAPDYIAGPCGCGLGAALAETPAPALDLDADGKEICNLSYLCPHHTGTPDTDQ